MNSTRFHAGRVWRFVAVKNYDHTLCVRISSNKSKWQDSYRDMGRLLEPHTPQCQIACKTASARQIQLLWRAIIAKAIMIRQEKLQRVVKSFIQRLYIGAMIVIRVARFRRRVMNSKLSRVARNIYFYGFLTPHLGLDFRLKRNAALVIQKYMQVRLIFRKPGGMLEKWWHQAEQSIVRGDVMQLQNLLRCRDQYAKLAVFPGLVNKRGGPSSRTLLHVAAESVRIMSAGCLIFPLYSPLYSICTE